MPFGIIWDRYKACHLALFGTGYIYAFFNKQNERNVSKMNNTQERESKEKQKNKKEESPIKWFVQVFIMTFILSMIFSYISANGVSHLNLVSAILILILVIAVGIFFDIIGVAVTVANEHEFHAKATKKVKGSKNSIKLIRNAPKVANICADVIRRHMPGF